MEWNSIVQFNEFDLRVSAVDSIVVNIIGVCNGFVEFCPDDNPPKYEEILCWIWAIRPDLTPELLNLENLNPGFRLLLKSYSEGDIDRFFESLV